jgi:hypothetical protein
VYDVCSTENKPILDSRYCSRCLAQFFLSRASAINMYIYLVLISYFVRVYHILCPCLPHTLSVFTTYCSTASRFRTFSRKLRFHFLSFLFDLRLIILHGHNPMLIILTDLPCSDKEVGTRHSHPVWDLKWVIRERMVVSEKVLIFNPPPYLFLYCLNYWQ